MDELDKLRAKFPKKDNDGITRPITPEPYHRLNDISDTMAQPDEKHKIPRVNDGRVDADVMAESIKGYRDFITIAESKESEVWVYDVNSGIYVPNGEKTIATLTEGLLLGLGLGSTATTHYV